MIPVLALISFVPLIIACIWIRNIEKHNREFWIDIFLVFAWGATISVIISMFLEKKAIDKYSSFLFLALIAAPVIEEFSKFLPLIFIKNKLDEIEDFLIFGTIAGLGFAATENLLYGIRFMDYDLIFLISLFYLRTIGTALLHASTTALAGYGFALKLLRRKSIIYMVCFLTLAIFIHSLFNLFVFSSQISNQIFGVVIAVLFAFSLHLAIRKNIVRLDISNLK